MGDEGRAVPEPIKRTVRQRCGFGCVICGLPLYEYEHMEGWSIVHRHLAEEITLLCDRHHRERTSGLLTIEAVREADRTPYNLKSGVTPGYRLHYSGRIAAVDIGGNRFEAALVEGLRQMSPLIVDGEPLVNFRLEDGHLLLSLSIYNVLGELILRIRDNELAYVVGNAWDFQFVGRVLTIRMGSHRVFCEMCFAVPSVLEVRRGFLLRNGVHIRISRNGIALANNEVIWSGCGFFGLNAGICIGALPDGVSAGFHASGVKRLRLQNNGMYALEA